MSTRDALTVRIPGERRMLVAGALRFLAADTDRTIAEAAEPAEREGYTVKGWRDNAEYLRTLADVIEGKR